MNFGFKMAVAEMLKAFVNHTVKEVGENIAKWRNCSTTKMVKLGYQRVMQSTLLER